MSFLVDPVIRYNLHSQVYHTAAGLMKAELLVDCTQPTGTIMHISMEENDIHLLPIEESVIDWSDREFFLGLAEVKTKFADTKNILGPAIVSDKLKPLGTRLVIWRYHNNSWGKEFVGTIDVQSFHRSKRGIIHVSFSPPSEKLKQTSVRIGDQWNNALGPGYQLNAWYPFTQVVTDMLKIINPGIQVTFFSNWNFYKSPGQTIPLSGLYFYLRSAFLMYLGEGQEDWAHENYLEALKALSLNFGLFIVLNSEDSASVYPLLDRPPELTIDDQVLIGDHQNIITEREIKYVKFQSLGRNLALLPPQGTPTGLEEDELTINMNEIHPHWWDNEQSAFRPIDFVDSPYITIRTWREFLALYYSSFYLSKLTTRRDKILIRGLYNCDVLIQKEGVHYLPLEARKHYKGFYTAFKAIPFRFVGEPYPIIGGGLFSADMIQLFSTDIYELRAKTEE